MKRATPSSARNRPRKKAAAPEPVPAVAPEAAPILPERSVTLTGGQNVSELEGALSVGMGLLFVIAALFPRSLKQLVMLSLGGGLLYRGMTRHCGVYEAMGVDTTNEGK